MVHFFPREGGTNAISLNPYNLCFPGRSGPPIFSLDPHLLVVSAIRVSLMKRGGCWTELNFTQNDHRFVCVKQNKSIIYPFGNCLQISI